VTLPPDAEAASLKRTRDLVKGSSWLRGLRLVALALTALAVMRLFRDGVWNESTRVFLFDAGGAAVAWVLYAVLLKWYRERALRS